MTTTTLRDRVQAAIPGYVDSARIIENAPALRPAPAATANEARTLLEIEIREHLLAGEPISADIADALLNAEQEQRRADTTIAAFERVVTIARDNIENITAYPGAEPFTVLDSELREVVSGVKNLLPDLDGATSANDAVNRGHNAVDAWSALQAYAERYDEIRTLQHELMPHDVPNYWDRLLTVGQFRDALHVHPHFAERRSRTVFTMSADYRTPHGLRPITGEHSWWPAGVDRPAGLLRIVTTTTPWVPAPDVLETAWSLAGAASANLGAPDDQRVIAQVEKNAAAYDEFVNGQ